MFRLRLTTVALACSVLALALPGCDLPWAQRTGAPPAPEAIAPGFSLTGLDGKTHALSAYRGRVVLVNFWATWCIPCRAEIPDLEHEARVHDPTKVVILGIDWKEPGPTAQQFLSQIGATYPVLLDSDGTVYGRYGVQALPQTFIVDRAGRLVTARTGIASRDQIEMELAAAGGG